ncbi:helix-turn-helix domain-containing protein [Aquimarina litoralis]|uniref:helix-turn-helix domain-containing protein n=1 Tax=Aquimarina litoralis TaxID=584605 RepID=UPI001C55CEE6|nr:helix-turn-helix domain-containing protein [Aquimarina litoralis]MBW1298874.1 helix-turn-helix domain-containing protein [Aquimarina litoralis]
MNIRENKNTGIGNAIYLLIGLPLILIIFSISDDSISWLDYTNMVIYIGSSIIFSLVLDRFFLNYYTVPFVIQRAPQKSYQFPKITTRSSHNYNEVSRGTSRKKVNHHSKKKRELKTTKTITNIPYLEEVFSEFDNDVLQRAPMQTISILSYFATSLFGKNKVDAVLWDIVENCISHLHLEDCVIYMLDKEKKYLIQKAAFGNKNNGEKKIVSPIKIKIGDGIVGDVAKTKDYRLIDDLRKNSNYIVDDVSRLSELSVPICIDGTIVGVLDSEHSEKDFFTSDHVFLFHLIAKLTEKKLKQICGHNTTCRITNDNIYYKELEFLMKEAKIYHDPNLGLDSVAKKLKISSNYLSQLVNKLTGKNFADYINTFRVEDAKEKLRNHNFVNYTIIGIALESGFNSKSTFYSAFKKLTGISPSSYRKNG